MGFLKSHILFPLVMLIFLSSPSPSMASTNPPAAGNGGADNESSSKEQFATILLTIDIVGLAVVVLLFIFLYQKAMKLKKLMKEANTRQQMNAEEEKGEVNRVEEGRKSISEGRKSVGEEKKLVFVSNEVRFELGDLLKASAEGLGKGNFGNCYKATLDDGPAVVVKRLRDLKPLTSEEFTRHLRFIADQKHPNLLPLLAYYYAKEEKLVVYKYAQRGNLFNRIFGNRGKKDRIPFRWSSRLSVARGVARAMEYLHFNTTIVVPHGNLKSSNVLLNENGTPLVSDYGLTSLIALPIAAQRMVLYKSPEYQNSKKASRKSDVWSFGILLLELLTGRMSIHSAPPGVNGVDLGSWVHRAVREEWTAEIFDMEISVQRSAAHGMLKLLQIAMRCCDKSPEKRPEMTEVVREIENLSADDSEDDDEVSSDRSANDD